MSEILRSKEAAIAATTAAIAAFSPAAEGMAADSSPAYSEGITPIVREAQVPSSSGFVFNGQEYKVSRSASISSASSEAAPTPDVATDEYRKACTEAALEPPIKTYTSRKGYFGIDGFAQGEGPFDVQTAILPTAIALYGPVKVNGELCDPSVVQRITTADLFIGKVPKKIVFGNGKHFFSTNDNKRTGSIISTGNSREVRKACRRAERRKGVNKGKVKLTLAALAIADIGNGDQPGIADLSDPNNLSMTSWMVRCKKPMSIDERKVKDNKNY